MDFASFIGIISGLFLIISAIVMGGGIDSFINLPGLMIVLGGTIAATLITFQMKDVISSIRAAIFVFSEQKKDSNDMVAIMVELCALTRRQGLMSLSKLDTDSDFLKKAANLIADGTKEELMRDTLNIEIESMKQRHFIIQDVFKKMALYSPSFGMLGTLIGLIQMLSELSNPETVGPAMAVALLTTFYGMVLATLLFNPIAGKLKQRTLVEVINLEIIFEGAISILQDNNPILVYEKLSSYVPNSLRRPMKQKVISNKYQAESGTLQKTLSIAKTI
jgi:chemotaxis protein MotA